jgi:pimeloyl-ACP methyl ester carboxylesterase
MSDETKPPEGTKNAPSARPFADELRAASRLAVEAVEGVTNVVEEMHHTIGGGPAILGQPFRALVELFSAPAYASIRGVTKLVGASLDRVLEELAPALGDRAPRAEYEAARAALNGVLGDLLADNGNALAIAMELRVDGKPLVLTKEALTARTELGGKLAVLVHGSSMDDASWLRAGHDHGARLAADLGFVPVRVLYNSGRHVSTNGRELAGLVDALVAAWPVAIEELVVIGFSMGGLVARAAIRAAEDEQLAWRAKLTGLATIGTPHHGAPLERAGNLVDVLLGVSRYSEPLVKLGQIRSAGVTDLRYGNVLDGDWQGRDRFARAGDPRTPCPLPSGVPALAIAASASKVLPPSLGPTAGDVDTLASDGLVPVASGLGRHTDPAHGLAFPAEDQHVVAGLHHLDLLSSAEAYEHLHRWLQKRCRPST